MVLRVRGPRVQPIVLECAQIGTVGARRHLGLDGDAVGDRNREKRARRRVNKAETREPVLDQPDIDGEVGARLDEFLGAVQRVDQEERPAQGSFPVGCGFLRHHGDGRREIAQRGGKNGVGVPVRPGHGGVVVLVLNSIRGAVMGHDRSARFCCGIGQNLCGGAEIEDSRLLGKRRCCMSWC